MNHVIMNYSRERFIIISECREYILCRGHREFDASYIKYIGNGALHNTELFNDENSASRHLKRISNKTSLELLYKDTELQTPNKAYPTLEVVQCMDEKRMIIDE